MRISTSTIYQSGISRIANLQSEQAKLSEQIYTGRRISSPSDDPVGSARALELSSAKNAHEKFSDTRQVAQSKLGSVETSLSSVTNLLVSAQSSLIAAGNGSYTDAERRFIGSELKGSLETLMGLANAQDESGNYLYAGSKTNSAPFFATSAGASYIGDSNQRLLQVDKQRQMAVNVTGDSVFQSNGNDVFSTISNIVTLLNTPITNAATQQSFNDGLKDAIGKLKGSVDNVLNVRSEVGNKLKEIDSLDVTGQDLLIQYSKSLSEIQDTDYATALSEFAKQQAVMEAAQKTFTQTAKLSLFSLL